MIPKYVTYSSHDTPEILRLLGRFAFSEPSLTLSFPPPKPTPTPPRTRATSAYFIPEQNPLAVNNSLADHIHRELRLKKERRSPNTFARPGKVAQANSPPCLSRLSESKNVSLLPFPSTPPVFHEPIRIIRWTKNARWPSSA